MPWPGHVIPPSQHTSGFMIRFSCVLFVQLQALAGRKRRTPHASLGYLQLLQETSTRSVIWFLNTGY